MIKTMFRLFGLALRDGAVPEPVDSLDRQGWEGLFKLSKKHDLAHLIGAALKTVDLQMDEDLQQAFDRAINTAVLRYVKINYDIETMIRALEHAKIRFLPLKGSVIRKYYKEPWLRTSCDIDFLVAEADLERAKEIFVNELHYTYESAWNYEVSFVTPSKTHIELHHVLSDDDNAINAVLAEVWERSAPREGYSFYYEMSDEMYYFYHIAHMVKHFVNGGCGIRPFLDIWVLNHGAPLDREKREALLQRAGLLQFAKAAEQLADVWVDGAPHTALTEALEQFILTGGTYGTVENRVAVQQVMTGGKTSYILSRIFLPYDQLKLTFPALEKRKWLYPFYQVKRWFRLFGKGKAKRSMNEVKTTSSVTTDEHRKTTDLLKELGIK